MDGVRLGGARTSGARRRGLPLSVLILRYFAYVLAGVLAAAIAAYLAFAIGVGGSSVYPANYGDTALEETTARIVALEGDDLDAFDAAIPSCYRWALVRRGRGLSRRRHGAGRARGGAPKPPSTAWR